MQNRGLQVEWVTVGLIVACTGVWMAATWAAGRDGLWPVLALAALCVTLHSSLQHEVLHGHPTHNRRVNEALVFLSPGLVIPFRRFKVLHLKHHNDPHLTDPYDDPESNYMDKADWDRLPRWVQLIREVNNTLAGRLVIGPALAIAGFVISEAKLLATGDRRVWIAWMLHAAGIALTLTWVMAVCGLGFWTYVFAVAYPGFSLLMIRTFLEHRAEQAVALRTCIVEDRSGFWSLLFLNNNLHVVHHQEPKLAWYKLPGLYARERTRYQESNGGYSFPSYWAIFSRYALRSKADVPHPFLRRGGP